MALPIRSALQSAAQYLVRNPLTVARLARHAIGLRVAVPLDALRWLVAHTPPGKKAPTDVTIATRPPAIVVGATLDLMGNKLRASASVKVDELRVSPDELRLLLRIADVELTPLGNAQGPLAMLLKSGAIDLKKPGNLANFLPKKPAALVAAKDDTITIDLMKVPKIADNHRVRQLLRTLTPVVNVAAIKTEGDMLILALRATPLGLPQSLEAVRG